MKPINEMTYTEKNEIAALFTAWLKPYTHEVIVKVMGKRDEIINNDFTMDLLKELKDRQEKESDDFTSAMFLMLSHYEDHKTYDPHNHPITHAGSYRDILYDMYIKSI